MRRSLTVAAVLWLAVPRLAECQAAKDAAELQALLAEFLAGASRNDAEMHDRFWADSLVYTRSTGRRIGKADLLKDVRSAPPGSLLPSYSAEDVRVQQFGDAAVVAFRLVGTTRAPGLTERDEFLNTGTFVRRDGRWQAVAWQATRVPPTEADARLQVTAFDKAFHAALLAADVKTLDNASAFARSVNAVVNTNDLGQFTPLLRRSVADNDAFYRVFREVLQAAGKR